MKCSYCEEIALFKCACLIPFFCRSHLGHHLASIPNHSFENIDITIPTPKLDRINSEIISRIIELKKAKAEISSKTKCLISLLDSSCGSTNKKLEVFINHYIEILGRQKFSKSEIDALEKIDSTKIKIKTVEVNEICQLVNETFSVELVSEIANLESKRAQFLKKHCSGFLCGALTDDCQKLVVGCSDSTLRIWDLINSQGFVLFGHNSEVNCLMLIINSRFIISGSSDNSIRIWNFANKAEDSLLKGHKSAVLALCFIETNSHIISGSMGGELFVWDFINRRKLKNIIAPSSIYSIIQMTIRGWIAFASGPEIVFFCLNTYKVTNIVKDDEFSVRCMILNKDESILISGFYNNSILIWSLETFEILCKMIDTPGIINSLSLTPKEDFIVSASSDSPISVWDIENGIKIKTLDAETSSVVSINNYSDKFILLFSNLNIGLLSEDFSDLKINCELKHFKLETLVISPKSNLIGFVNGLSAFIYNRDSDAYVSSMDNHERPVQFIEISNDEKFALTGILGKKNNFIYWSLNLSQVIGSLVGHTNTVLCANFSKDCFRAVSGSADKSVVLWDLREKKLIFKLVGHSNEVCSVKFMENEENAVSAGNDMCLIIWDLKNESKIQVISEHKYKICKLLLMKGDKYAISCDKTDGIRVWNLKKKQPKIIQNDVASWLERKSNLLDLVKQYIKY